MYKHYQKHENDLRELVQYAESLTDSVSLVFPSDSIPPEVSKEQYEHVIRLLKKLIKGALERHKVDVTLAKIEKMRVDDLGDRIVQYLCPEYPSDDAFYLRPSV